jgi:hypothetical protein
VRDEVRKDHIGFVMRMQHSVREEFVFERREETLGNAIDCPIWVGNFATACLSALAMVMAP